MRKTDREQYVEAVRKLCQYLAGAARDEAVVVSTQKFSAIVPVEYLRDGNEGLERYLTDLERQEEGA